MRKMVLLLTAVTATVMLMIPAAFAAPVNSATEPDRPTVDIPNEDVPLVDIPNEDVPLVDIPDEDIPLVSSPQTGETGLSGAEALGLVAAGLAIGGIAVLARKQNLSVR